MPDDALTDDPLEEAAAEALADKLSQLFARYPHAARTAAAREAGLLPPEGAPATQDQVAEVVGLSRRMVRKIELKALGRLRIRLRDLNDDLQP
jgi:DNA-directed RNA polymerase sigma subunit (sigma70/sigma32)